VRYLKLLGIRVPLEAENLSQREMSDRLRMKRMDTIIKRYNSFLNMLKEVEEDFLASRIRGAEMLIDQALKELSWAEE
jgi:hypothetical protein